MTGKILYLDSAMISNFVSIQWVNLIVNFVCLPITIISRVICGIKLDSKERSKRRHNSIHLNDPESDQTLCYRTNCTRCPVRYWSPRTINHYHGDPLATATQIHQSRTGKCNRALQIKSYFYPIFICKSNHTGDMRRVATWTDRQTDRVQSTGQLVS